MSGDVGSEMKEAEPTAGDIAIDEVVALNADRLAIGKTASDKAWEFANKVFEAFTEFGKTKSAFAKVDKKRPFHAQLVLASAPNGALDEWPEDSSKAASTVQYCQKLIRAAALMASDSMAEFRSEILLSEAITMSSFCTKAKDADTVRNLITSRHTASDWREDGASNASSVKTAAREVLGLSNPKPPSGNDSGSGNDNEDDSEESVELSNIAILNEAATLLTFYNGLTQSENVKLSDDVTEAIANLTGVVLANISDIPEFLDDSELSEMVEELTE